MLAFTALTLAVCFGLGRLLLRVWRSERFAASEPDTTAWVGWGAAVAFIQLWHLALAPGRVLAAALCAGGAAGLALTRAEVRALLDDAWRRHRGALVAVVLAALWLANTSLGPPRNGDSGLYHLQAVRWAAAFPDVPGLANLLGRLGFTSSYTLYLALPEALAGTGRACHLANAVLLLLPIARGISAVSRIAGAGSPCRASTLFDALAVFPLLERVWSEQVLTSATPDLPVFVLGIVVTSLLLRATEAAGDRALNRLRTATVVWLATVGVTVKLSFAGFAAAAAALAIVVRLRTPRSDRAGAATPPPLAPLAASCAALAVPWLTRSVVLSGYPLYPFPWASVAVDWRVPRTAALDDFNWVRSWARQPGADWHAVLGGWGWFPGWVHDLVLTRYTLLTVIAPLALALAAIAARAVLRRGRAAGDRTPLSALLPAALGLVYWFATAPAPRFAGSAFWVLGLGAFAAAAEPVPGVPSRRRRIALLLAMGGLTAAVFAKLWERGLLPVAAGPDGGFHAAPVVATREVRTASGLAVNVPEAGENCWDAPFPCTPWLDPALRLRRAGDLRRGFAVAAPPAWRSP